MKLCQPALRRGLTEPPRWSTLQSVTSSQTVANNKLAPVNSATFRCIREMVRTHRIEDDVLEALADMHYHRYLADPSCDGGRWAGRLWNARSMSPGGALEYLAQWS